MRLVLASKSAWRKQLLGWLNLPFVVMESGVNEDRFMIEDPDDLVCSLAVAKAERAAVKLEENRVFGAEEVETVIIGADTVIVMDGAIIGKPENRKHAHEIIQTLSGRTHEVWTGVCVLSSVTGEKQIEGVVTEVTFLPLNDEEIEGYLATNEWVGKAGGYQIQGAIRKYVREIDGSETSVIGLPLKETVDMLEHAGVVVPVSVERVLAERMGGGS